MKILVIGATGFVGKAIVRELLTNSIEVVAIGGPKSAGESEGPNTFNSVDITNSRDIERLEKIQDVDAVVHAAGLAHQIGKVTDDELWNTNVHGTENIARLSVKLKARHFLLISSVLVYGREHTKDPDPRIISEESPCHPDDIYAKSKLAAEEIASEICSDAKIPLTIFRPAPIIGEGSKGNFSRLVKLIAKRRFVWLGKGRNRKSLVSIDDVARACFVIINEKKTETEIFNVSGPAIEMKEVVNQIVAHIGRNTPRLSIPAEPVIRLLKFISRIDPGFKTSRLVKTLEKWISDDIYSGEKINRQYGFVANSNLSDVIRQEVDWYIRHK